MPHFIYRIQPTRLEMLSGEPTEHEAMVVAKHFEYLEQLTDAGQVLMAGRTLVTDERTFGVVIFSAESEAAARAVVLADPAVQQDVMKAELLPFRVALWSARSPDSVLSDG